MKEDAELNLKTTSGSRSAAFPLASAEPPVKKHLIACIILSVAAGSFAYLSVSSQRAGQFGKATQYTLFSTFCVMAPVFLLVFNAYNAYLRRRKDRGDRIGRG